MCTFYEGCLDETLRRRWHGFSCRKCLAFQPLQLDPTEWLLDCLVCIALIGVSEFESSFKQKPRGGIVEKLQHIQSRSNILDFS
jgi:hypothetical protein